MEFINKQEMLSQLREYAKAPDDDSIRFKEKIKQTLLKCPQILYMLDNPIYEGELFDANGNLIEDGEWDIYFGDNIRPYIYFPEIQDETKNYICYKVGMDNLVEDNTLFKNCLITFTIFCNGKNGIDKETGIARHDLIAAMLTEEFNWTNIFGLQCELVDSFEAVTEHSFITKQLEFQCIIPNAIVQTDNGVTSVINKYGR